MASMGTLPWQATQGTTILTMTSLTTERRTSTGTASWMKMRQIQQGSRILVTSMTTAYLTGKKT